MERNRSKRKVSRIMAGMLTMLLCMTSSLSVWAGTSGTQATPEEAEFTKTLQYADGVGLTAPNVTFTFTFDEVSLDGATTPAVVGTMPAIGPETLSFSSADTVTISGGMNQITKTSGDVLSGLTWPGTGVYEYEVTETAGGFTPAVTAETMNYSQAVYTLYVVVSYDSATSSYFVEQAYTNQTVDNTGGTGSGKGGANTADGDYNFLFTNTYTKQGGTTAGTDALTITKTTTGTGSDQSKQFTYTLTADDSVTGVAPAAYTGTITRAGGGTSTVSLTADGSTAATFALADGDEIVFNTLPAGTTFEVEETGAASYIATYSGTTAAGAISSGTGTVGAALSTGTQTIGTTDNEVNFTNTYDSSLIPTGVLSDIAPFLVLTAAAVLAFAVFAATNRRKASR